MMHAFAAFSLARRFLRGGTSSRFVAIPARRSLPRLMCLAALSAGAALACDAPLPVGLTHAAIVDGRAAPEFEAVALLGGPQGRCSATLISPCTVVTAKHCVQDPDVDTPRPAASFTLFLNREEGERSAHPVASLEVVPGPYASEALNADGLVGEDLAVLVLAEPVEGIEPARVAQAFDPGWIGQGVTAVGFGETPEGGASSEQLATDRVLLRRLGSVAFTEAATCVGDSGGALFSPQGELFGVASFGAPNCGDGVSGFTLLEPYTALLERGLQACGACLDDGEERCDGFDNDCDDEIDEDCLALEASCTDDASCGGGLCAAEGGQGPRCLQACDVVLQDCPAELRCIQLEGRCAGACLDADASTVDLDGPCTSHAECASGFCFRRDDGTGLCRPPCAVDAGSCEASEACALTETRCGACVPAEEVAVRGMGERCRRDEDCRGAVCLEVGAQRVCSARCAADRTCAVKGFHCVRSNCVPGERQGLAGSCLESDNCVPGLSCEQPATREALAVGLCTRDCSEEACPDGLFCRELDEARLCLSERLPLTATCDSDDNCESLRCESGRCAAPCPVGEPCPPGLRCTAQASGEALCVPPVAESFGCSLRSAPSAWGLMLVLGFWARRRRVSRYVC